MLPAFRRRRKTQEQKLRGCAVGYSSVASPSAVVKGEPGAELPVAGGMPLARDLGTEVLRAEQHFRLCLEFQPFRWRIWNCFPEFCLLLRSLNKSQIFPPDPLFFRGQVRTSFQVCLTFLTNGADLA